MKNLIFKLADYVSSAGKYIFVNDYFGWDEKQIALNGFEYIEAMEGNGLKSTFTGETYIPQYSSIRKANHLELQMRSYNNEGTNVDERLSLKCANDIVIITNNESVIAFAPVYSSKLDLAIFLATIEEYCGENLDRRFALRDCISLAKFLYKNNPHKVVSIIDEL